MFVFANVLGKRWRMGGYGSGRWDNHSKATTVEECRLLNISRWVREGVIAPDTSRRGLWVWTNSYTGERTASIGYEVDTTGSPSWARLLYTYTPMGGEPESCDYTIQLVTTRPHFGGLRWWFVCPLRGCGRRVGKLYLPPGGRYYGCRHCYQLTYESCQESHKYDRLWRKLAEETGYEPHVIARVMKRGRRR
jgi:hypothetical protein